LVIPTDITQLQHSKAGNAALQTWSCAAGGGAGGSFRGLEASNFVTDREGNEGKKYEEMMMRGQIEKIIYTFNICCVITVFPLLTKTFPQ
jgi:hypothetical protein